MALVDQPLLIYLLSRFKELQHFAVDPEGTSSFLYLENIIN